MKTVQSLIASLHDHRRLVEEVLSWVETEARALSSGQSSGAGATLEAKRALLSQINQSLRRLKLEREAWQAMPMAERNRHPEVISLMQATQDLLMKTLLRDRENEQALLKLGEVPAQHFSKIQAPVKPHFVSDLYRRHQASSFGVHP